VKRAGLVGGLGPESTIDYYRRILGAWERQHPGSSPWLVIDSLDVQVGLRLVRSDRAALIEYLLESLRRLAGAGGDRRAAGRMNAADHVRRPMGLLT
jgi:aspartate racemase